MLFNSFEFIFAFLPLALIATYAAGRWRQSTAKVVLLVLSLAFYAYWRLQQLPLLLFSIIFNYIVGGLIQRYSADGRTGRLRALLIFGVLVDVGMLGWFKYANFVTANLDAAFGTGIHLAHIALPLAISFFTFQKIAYLIDSARGETKPISFLDFSLFAAFFPQLIAGPIVHFKEIIPQLQSRRWGHLIGRNILVGLVMFAMGLFKKTVIADTLATYANPLFHAGTGGHALGLGSAWLAALSFTLQLYFDFSGYSDMAIGLGRMLGVKLPLNFHSPLRAANIMNYWRRWHMTLQRFIVAYIFQPLSLPLNRFAARRGFPTWPAFAIGVCVPTIVTFLVVGIWHGAGWTFVIFGLMHAVYICVNEVWREVLKRRRRRLKRAGRPAKEPGKPLIVFYHAITLIAVMYANVVFRTPHVRDAVGIWSGMTGLQGGSPAGVPGLDGGLAATLALGIALVFLAPNTQQILGRFDPAYNWREWSDVGHAPLAWTWRPNTAGLLFAAAAFLLGVLFIERGRAVFLYFNF
jgi:alginate O-acetyltransferase complex protein AlgI